MKNNEIGPMGYERDHIPTKDSYVICYSSPYYWLYNEYTNTLIMKDVDEKKVRNKLKQLESGEDHA